MVPFDTVSFTFCSFVLEKQSISDILTWGETHGVTSFVRILNLESIKVGLQLQDLFLLQYKALYKAMKTL